VVDVAERQRWMSLLAQAKSEDLDGAWKRLPTSPSYRVLRGPETGLVMVRGRAGGTGARFNLGEMTVTRCTVELADGYIGHAYVEGRSGRRAEQAAALDALLQEPTRRAILEELVVAPLLAKREGHRSAVRARAAGTRVEFFTMVRGEA
jgi:alpha-D-ribose 1-methylphosphonate 5-triphosphate synthase subunit PhnG